MFRRASCPSPLLVLLLLLGCLPILSAADPKPEPKDDDPTGPEFVAQGEYSGEVVTPVGSSVTGVQIVALGNGKFRAVGFEGGLPGDGWDHSQRHTADGQADKDGLIEFKGPAGAATLKKGVLTITLAGLSIGDLKKVDRESATLGAPPPDGAVVLFDGSTVENFEKGRMTEDGLLLPGCTSKQKFGSGKLHVEFLIPFMPNARDQGRGNSGIFVQGRYEVQVLDSFGEPEASNGCGAIYSLKAPDTNMSFPPGVWQTYDIDLTAADYKDGAKVKDPMITVKQNDVAIVRRTSLPQASPGAPVQVGEEPGPVHLQDHGNAVRYRNIWFLKKAAEKPVEKAPEAK